ncbi:hypothetical protein EYF80_048469 [Liparis tanakae]|uniref:Uncharacterized protein n=1 Tax=Liparis tanakae TaxID=230148 RepID=A0A4Z2FJI2_9TELE|nr:hypothetical protein EYF80_048469 [Liparis tanakae]
MKMFGMRQVRGLKLSQIIFKYLNILPAKFDLEKVKQNKKTTTCTSDVRMTRVLPDASAAAVVMSRLQEMQHYICLQPTGTRTRSCYVIKECYPASVCVCVCVCVCVWLNPLGLATIDSI